MFWTHWKKKRKMKWKTCKTPNFSLDWIYIKKPINYFLIQISFHSTGWKQRYSVRAGGELHLPHRKVPSSIFVFLNLSFFPQSLLFLLFLNHRFPHLCFSCLNLVFSLILIFPQSLFPRSSFYLDIFPSSWYSLFMDLCCSRSDFWRNQKPMYVEEGERMTRRMSMMEDTETRMRRGVDKMALFTIRLNI